MYGNTCMMLNLNLTASFSVKKYEIAYSSGFQPFFRSRIPDERFLEIEDLLTKFISNTFYFLQNISCFLNQSYNNYFIKQIT